MNTTTAPGWVLVVDDDATDRLLLFRLLEWAGYHATVTDNGAAAIELLRTEPFDLVLLDLVMPQPDGYAVLQTMRDEGLLRTVPVIMISGVAELEATVRCIELGADDYLDKPIDPVLLRARIDASLEKKRLREREAEYHDVIGHLARAVREMGSQNEDLRTKINTQTVTTMPE